MSPKIRFSDDMELVRKGGGKLNKFQKAIISWCLFEFHNYGFNSIPQSINSYDSFFDLNKEQIKYIHEQLPYVKKELNNPNFLNAERVKWCFIGCKIIDQWEKPNPQEIKLIQANSKNAIKDIEKFLQDYDTALKHSSSSKDLEDSGAFIERALKALEKVANEIKAKKRPASTFEQEAANYGCNEEWRRGGFETFNQFLRNNNFKDTDPKIYAAMMARVDALRKGLLSKEHRTQLNDKEITLYRGMSFIGFIGLLKDSLLITQNQIDSFNKKANEEIKEDITEELKQKKDELEQLENKMEDEEDDDDIYVPSKKKRKPDSGASVTESAEREKIEYLKNKIKKYENLLKNGYFTAIDSYSNFPSKYTNKHIINFNKVIDKILNSEKGKGIIHDRAFMSTSSILKATNQFNGGILLTIECIPGTIVRGADISNFSGHKGQAETLFAPDTAFKLVDFKHKDPKGRKYELTLQTIAPKKSK